MTKDVNIEIAKLAEENHKLRKLVSELNAELTKALNALRYQKEEPIHIEQTYFIW